VQIAVRQDQEPRPALKSAREAAKRFEPSPAPAAALAAAAAIDREAAADDQAEGDAAELRGSIDPHTQGERDGESEAASGALAEDSRVSWREAEPDVAAEPGQAISSEAAGSGYPVSEADDAWRAPGDDEAWSTPEVGEQPRRMQEEAEQVAEAGPTGWRGAEDAAVAEAEAETWLDAESAPPVESTTAAWWETEHAPEAPAEPVPELLDEHAAEDAAATAAARDEWGAEEPAGEADSAAENEPTEWLEAQPESESASPLGEALETREAAQPEAHPEPAMAAEHGDEEAPAEPAVVGVTEDASASIEAAPETPAPAPMVSAAAIPERAPPGTAELAEIVASDAVRVALFAGAEGGEGTGEIAYATARQVVRKGERSVVVDLGTRPSPVLSPPGEPGLAELLAGTFSFGEVIRRDEPSNVHVIPTGKGSGAPYQRLQLVIGALTHTYDKVVVVADSVADWPAENLKPDLAAIVCGPATTEDTSERIYQSALDRGARSAIIVRYASDGDGLEASEAA
jgi:Mrp family chromosome partitioning ATPase